MPLILLFQRTRHMERAWSSEGLHQDLSLSQGEALSEGTLRPPGYPKNPPGSSTERPTCFIAAPASRPSKCPLVLLLYREWQLLPTLPGSQMVLCCGLPMPL